MTYAQHFSQEEFREWAEDMSPRLITMQDCPVPERAGETLGDYYWWGW